MISESDGYKCKVKEWEIEEEMMSGGDYPQISVEGSYEFFPYSMPYSWDENVVEETIGNRKIRYKRELYYARGVILEDDRVIHIDGRNAPNSDELSEKYHAKYNNDDLKVTTYTIEEIDENGNVVFSHSVDSIPDILHDIADYLGIAEDDDEYCGEIFEFSADCVLKQYIGDGCDAVIVIPEFAISIGDYAFSNHGGLTSIEIPGSVTSIGEGAFSGCSGLTSITYTGTMAQWNDIKKGESWDNHTGNYTIHCADGDIAKGK